MKTATIQCGSGLAREGGVSVDTFIADRPYSRASPLPHFDLRRYRRPFTGRRSPANAVRARHRTSHPSPSPTG
ncbi:hypothetical protein C9382_00465 [Pseudomonas aylmerensis]|uniref:Uncharacterized protein n=1 Tax=Pseudomonas aylmerensis TaxID=1869229 RepID=A0A2T4GC39_9PSED|nr:hypothetical protein C9382_00465 [Pseudomonas aylmerensis]